MSNLSPARLKSTFANLYRSLEKEGATYEVELSWLELQRYVEDAGSQRTELIVGWNQFGHLLFDKRRNYGLALHYKIESIRAETLGREPEVEDYFGAFVYASMHDGGMAEIIRCLGFFEKRWDGTSVREKKRIKEVAIEYLVSLGERTLPVVLTNSIASLFLHDFTIGPNKIYANEVARMLVCSKKVEAGPSTP